jgi:hypothetical protein
MINLPTKDKFGNNYLSYSQINCFLKSKNDYYKTYILKEPFFENKYLKFGKKVGNALQHNDYSLFTNQESEILKKCTRLDIFEKKTILKFDDFYMIGFIDTCSNDLNTIIDYKTGGIGKEFNYYKDDYNQLCYYALSILQETGKSPNNAFVEFIRRDNYTMKVCNEHPITIDVNISENRLNKVFNDTIIIAKEISDFYKQNIK